MSMPSLSRRSFVQLASTLLVACGPPAKEPPKYAIRPADDLLRLRVQAAYDGVRRSARFWPGFEKTDVKAMLIRRSRQPHARRHRRALEGPRVRSQEPPHR